MDLARRTVDGIFAGIMLYLVFSQADGFSKVLSSTAQGVSQVAFTLQGRK